MEDENHHNPFFGIFLLKRLSCRSQRPIPLSRETLNAFRGTLVKSRNHRRLPCQGKLCPAPIQLHSNERFIDLAERPELALKPA